MFRKFAVAILLVLIVTSFSCRKTSLLGVNVLPDSDFINGIFSDTFSLITKTVRDDSIPTSSLVNNVLGSMYDPVFGRTSATIFTEIDLLSNNIDFGNPDTLFIDSAVLSLVYAGAYGYYQVPQSVKVHELSESITPVPDGGYYSNKAFGFYSSLLGEKTNFAPDPTDSFDFRGTKQPPQLRIRLNDRFGQRFLNESQDSGFADLDHFHEFFHGFCIEPDTVSSVYGGGLMLFNMLSNYTGLHIFYHTPTRDSLNYTFPVTSNVSKTNFYKHNYYGTPIVSYLQPDTLSDSLVFVQPLGGLKTSIRIPNIMTLQNVIINKAELVVTQVLDASGLDTVLSVPSQLVCITSTAAGKDTSLPDIQLSFPSFGGVKSSFTNNAGQVVARYTFSIAEQIQHIVDSKTEDYGLLIIPYRRGETVNRLQAGGAERNDDMKLKLNLIYTPINP